eukprot:30831-Pelagococcus_subviridis.AAC.15
MKFNLQPRGRDRRRPRARPRRAQLEIALRAVRAQERILEHRGRVHADAREERRAVVVDRRVRARVSNLEMQQVRERSQLEPVPRLRPRVRAPSRPQRRPVRELRDVRGEARRVHRERQHADAVSLRAHRSRRRARGGGSIARRRRGMDSRAGRWARGMTRVSRSARARRGVRAALERGGSGRRVVTLGGDDGRCHRNDRVSVFRSSTDSTTACGTRTLLTRCDGKSTGTPGPAARSRSSQPCDR